MPHDERRSLSVDHTDAIYEPVPQNATLEPRLSITKLPQPAVMREDDIVSEKDGQNSTLTVSRWSVGWKTPTLIIVPYVLASLTAVAHICFFVWIRGKSTKIIPQSYVTTSSTIMAQVIGLLLQICLGTAFTQYVWRLIRVTPYKTSTFDDFLSMRSNVSALLRVLVKREAWILATLSLFLWLIPIAVSFPPGAVTVEQQSITSRGIVPSFGTFNLSNVTFDSISAQSLAYYDQLDGGFIFQELECDPDPTRSCTLAHPSVQVLAESTMLNGKRGEISSPCGANCLYTLHFQGPYLQCSSATTNITIDVTESVATVYNSTWTNLPYYRLPDAQQNALQTSASFTFIVLQANAYGVAISGAKLNATQNIISCVPSRADYEVINTYKNNIQSLELKVGNVQPLINLGHELCWPALSPVPVKFPTPLCSTGNTTYQLAYIRDSNLMAMMQAMAASIIGSYEAGVSGVGDLEVSSQWNWTNATFVIDTELTSPSTIVANTPLCTYKPPRQRDVSDPGSSTPFIVNQDILNSILANITLSSISAFNLWKETTNVTQDLTDNAYSFSRPLNIGLPYGLVFALALPFLGLGLWSLYMNGVPAQNGGFFQILVTTRGSEVLDKAARVGCLGGEENVPQALRDIKVRFGEFIGVGEKEGNVAMAGFGTEDEVKMIQKGKLYGGGMFER